MSKIGSFDTKCCGAAAEVPPAAEGHGPGYASPDDAFRNSFRERILFVTCPNVDHRNNKPDLIASVDVDPDSASFCKIIGQLELPYCGDEVHHTGWNSCSSCYGRANCKRTHLVVPCLNSSRIYKVNVSEPEKPKLDKIIEPDQLASIGISAPHTAHCLGDGSIMISTMGNERGEGRGDFVLVDGNNFELLGKWEAESGGGTKFGYDFWYQPRQNLMISTEWGVPNKFKGGFNPAHVAEGAYGNCVHVWDWRERRLRQTIELAAPEGQIPLEVRFLHNPMKPIAFVGTALGSAIFHFWMNPTNEGGEGRMLHRLAASVPPKRVRGWALEWMPALVTDILVSMDDRFLYISCWLHGDIRQYDITDPFNVKLVGKCFVGGSIHSESGVTVLEDKELKSQPLPTIVCGRAVEGGPQMLQLSLDGRRLYVTNSLYSQWDAQFYPELIRKGSTMLQLDVDTDRGGLRINEKFRVDFDRSEQLPNGPYLAHEMRYPGGDCTSDIWL